MLSLWLNVLAGGVLLGLVYGLVALDLTIIFGVMRVANFAHSSAEFVNNTGFSGPILACSRLPRRTGVSDGK
jgi:branched-subunit amino acid ABC-type transport system permease component